MLRRITTAVLAVIALVVPATLFAKTPPKKTAPAPQTAAEKIAAMRNTTLMGGTAVMLSSCVDEHGNPVTGKDFTDPPALYADPALAAEKLGFQALYSDLDTIIRTAAPFFGLEVRT